MISYRDFKRAFAELDIGSHSRVLLHAAIEPFGNVAGGAESLIGALLSTCEMVITPAFTHQTMVTPGVGPDENAMIYGSGEETNLSAVIFNKEMPVDEGLGIVNETLRLYPDSERSTHPILSFVGVNAADVLAEQTLEAPFGPVAWLADLDGDVLMIGRDQRANISLHWGEQLAGRKTFVRWALTAAGVVECPNMPGCSEGFDAIRGRLGAITRHTSLNAVLLEAIPIRDLVNLTVGWIREDPRALLCDRTGCSYCASVRADVRVE